MNHFIPAMLLITWVVVSPAVSAGGEIYKWVDENGVVHFQDHPPATGQAPSDVKVIETEERVSTPYVPPPATDTVETVTPPASSPPVVVMYTVSWCGYCAKARDFFRDRGIIFTDYDIEKDKQAAWRRKSLTDKQGMPLVIINGIKIVGYSESHYEQALARH